MNGRENVHGQRGRSHISLLWLLGWLSTSTFALGSPSVSAQAGAARAGSVQETARKPFSQAERARLLAGELVARPVQEQRGSLRLIGGSSWQIVKASPDVVFRALLDTKHYPNSLPTVSRASVVSDQPGLRRVRLEHKKGPLGVAYRLVLQIDAQRRDLNFKLNDRLESGIRAAWGFFSVQPYGSGYTLLSFGVMADPGDGLVVGLVRGVIQDWLLKVPAQVKQHVESAWGRRLYPVLAVAGGCGKLDGGQAQQCAP